MHFPLFPYFIHSFFFLLIVNSSMLTQIWVMRENREHSSYLLVSSPVPTLRHAGDQKVESRPLREVQSKELTVFLLLLQRFGT